MLLSNLATLYAPYESGAKVPATNISISGQDLSDLFAPAANGAASAPATGILVNNVDISTLFAAVGTTVKLLTTWAGSYSGSEYSSGTVSAFVSLAFNVNNTFASDGVDGFWLSSGFAATDYEIKAELKSGDALSGNDMAVFSPFDAQRAISLSATAAPGSTAFMQSLVEITIRLIADPAVSVTRGVTLTVSAESWGPEGTLPP